MKTTKKILSLLLVFVIMCTSLIGYSSVLAETQANENQVSNIMSNNTTSSLSHDNNGNITLEENANAKKEELKLPDIVKEDLSSSEFIARAKSKEKDLNTFVFKNKDGTQTMKVYSHPVKYIDEKGNIQDISTDIKVNNNGTFETKANSIKTLFSNKLKDGITLTHDNVNIRLVSDKASEAKLSNDNKIVSYFYDDKTTIEYSLTYTGFKEDIVVKEYTGQTEYEFTLYTNGLTLVKENGSYFLKDGKGKVQATIGDIIIFTADERNNAFGDMTHETVTPNQEYVMTIHVDKEYLVDEKTKYPIRIDPTIEINYDDSGVGAIEDFTISQGTTYGGASGSLYIGRNTDGTLSRALMRFPNLDLTGISASQITNAYVELKDLMCQDDEPMVIECRPYLNTAPSWSEAQTVTWTSVGTNYYGAVLDSHEVLYGQGNAPDSGSIHRYRFDLTLLARDWANGTQSAAKGIVLKATDSFEAQTGSSIQYWKKTFASYNRSANKPVFTLGYENTFSVNESEISILEGEIIYLSADVPLGYTLSWQSSDENVATINSNGMVTGLNAGMTTITATMSRSGNTPIVVSSIIYVRIEDGVYIIENCMAEYSLNTNVTYDYFPLNIDEVDETDVYNAIRTMWKIKYLSHGMYSIRPMSMLTMGLGYDEEEYGVLLDIGTEDTYESVGEYARWSIVAENDVYKLLLDGDYDMVLQLDRAFMSCGTSVVIDVDDDMIPSGWSFWKVTEPPEGVMLYNTIYDSVFFNMLRKVEENTTKALISLHIKPAVYSADTNSQEIVWTSDNPSVVSVNSQTGTITTYSLSGGAKITGTVTIGDNVYTVTFRIEVSNFNQGRYFIRNSEYETFLQPSVTSGNINETSIKQYAWTGTTAQEWDITPLGAGYYKICSAATGLALTLPNGAAITGNVTLIQKQYQGSDYQIWRITETSENQYKIRCKASEIVSSDFAMVSAPLQNNSAEGVDVQQNVYINDNIYSDEWNIYFDSFFILYTGITEYADTSDGIFNLTAGIRMNNVYGSSRTAMTVQEFLNEITGHSVFYCVAHGSISQNITTNLLLDTQVSLDDIASLPDNALCDVDLVILACCWLGLGRGNGTNMANAIYAKGAKCVIAFDKKVYLDVDKWVTLFNDEIGLGSTIEAAKNYASDFIEGENNTPVGSNGATPDPATETPTKNPYVVGNSNVTLF